jgi:phosphatidylglycerol:prolipoprotein diacylglycerol transferase
MTLAAWLHDLDPVIVRIAGDFAVRWYGVAYAIGFMLGWAQFTWLYKRGAGLLSAARVPDAMMTMIFGVILGGRLGYVFIYEPTLLTATSSSFPFWGVLMINKGGMAFHGAIAGLLLAAWWISRGVKVEGGRREGAMPFSHMIDLMAFVAPAGLMLGRLANFINGELLGQIVAKPGEVAPWWAVKYPQEIASEHFVPYTAEQARELGSILDRFGRQTLGEGHAAERLVHEIQTGAGVAHANLLQEVANLVSARHPSQLYQAFAEGPVLALVLWIVWAKPKKSGTLACAFLIAYGVCRVIIEQFFRLPDPQLHVQRILGLSRGQWLSAAMLAAGVIGLAFVYRKGANVVRLGGWLSQKDPAETLPRT